MRVDTAWVRVRVRASGPLGDPVGLRLQGRELRVWFPDAGEGRADIEGDGAALRWVRLRPGYGTTGLVRIGLRAGHRLEAARVQVHSMPRGAEVRLPREAFPRLANAEPDEGSTGRPAAEGTPASARPHGGERSAEPASAPVERRGDAEGAREAKRAERASSGEPLGIREEAGLGALATMLLLVGLLGAAFAAVHWARRRRGEPLPMPIEVVASKRMGPRHQLVLVRALGEEHLLSVQGTQTTCIASAPIEGERTEEAETLRSGVRRRLSRADLAGSRPRSLFDRMVRREAMRGAEVSSSEAGQEAARRFGVALIRRAASGAVGKTASQAPRAAGSEAVAGLVALRRRAASGR